MMGPMPPLHDVMNSNKYFLTIHSIQVYIDIKAAQNGHLEVVRLLLKAGALVYSFDHDVRYSNNL